MKVFAINLKDSVERKEHIIKECAKYGIIPEICEAVDGRLLTEQELLMNAKDYKINGLTRGEIGCSLSHLNIYKKIIEDNIDIALILEDDAIFKEDINKILEEINKFNKSTDKSFLYLLSKSYSYISNRSIKLGSITLYDIYRASLTHGYVINNKAAKSLAAYVHPVRYTADDWKMLKFGANINIFCVVPEITDTLSSFSSVIQGRNEFEKMRRAYMKKLFFIDFSTNIKIFIYRFLQRPLLKVVHIRKSTTPIEKIKKKLKKIFNKQ